jgi:hypothetical protein
VLLGTAVIANGLLAGTSATAANLRPTTFLLADSTVSIRVEHLDGTPVAGPYASGWQPGTVEVRAYADFRVTQFNPGAVLQLRDVVVH